MQRFPLLFLLICSIVVTLFLQGCDVYSESGYKKQYVVESYLVAGQPLPSVLLSHTVPADEAYRFSKTAVSGADISIALLNSDGDIEKRISYTEDSAGVYGPTQVHIVKPRRRYRLRARINSEKVLTATTVVPNSYRLTGSVADTTVYQSDQQIEVTLIPDAPDTLKRQKQFVFTIISREYKTAPPTPFYADQLEGEESQRSDYRNNSSGIVSEGNFSVNPDGSINIKVPWIGFAFYGKNDVVTNSIDENLYDFIRTQSVQLGGSTLSPGEIPNIAYNVKGGIGIFGSITTDTVSTYLIKPASGRSSPDVW